MLALATAALLAAAAPAVSVGACQDGDAVDPLHGLGDVVKTAAPRRAVHDPALDVWITSDRELRYDDGADPRQDRPGFVRAGSGLAIAGDTLWIAQDDANFLGRVDLTNGAVDAVPLARGEGGVRLFDDGRGNKKHKMDLEALIPLPDGGLLAIASGSSSRRFRSVLVRPGEEPRVIDAPAFFGALAADRAFAGVELNLEGGVAFRRAGRTWIRLFQRGNGDTSLGPVVDATAEFPLDALLEDRPAAPSALTAYELGDAAGVRLTFSDAAAGPGGETAFLASAEDSSNTITDGSLHGVVLGRIDALTREARYGRIYEADGRPSSRKLEGLAWDAASRRWLAIEDADDASKASRLVTLESR